MNPLHIRCTICGKKSINHYCLRKHSDPDSPQFAPPQPEPSILQVALSRRLISLESVAHDLAKTLELLRHDVCGPRESDQS